MTQSYCPKHGLRDERVCYPCSRELYLAEINTSAQADMSDIARENAMSPRGGYTIADLNKVENDAIEIATQIEQERIIAILRKRARQGRFLDVIIELINAPAVPATTDTMAERE